jgi:nucleotide-binding universal stress UspA family protein
VSVGSTFTPPTVWDRVVCAVDQDPGSIAAARTAARLMPATASLTMVTVRDPYDGDQPTGDLAAVAQAHNALKRIEAIRDVELHLREGSAIERILEEVRAEQATLLTLGARDHADGMVLGRVTTALTRDAQASVLIAHEEVGGSGEIVVGFDGSGGAGRALAAAQELAARLLLPVRVVIATGDDGATSPARLREDLDPALEVISDPRPAVEALIDASQSASLIAVGSRHLQGVLASASVSEHTAGLAHCPVLVLR